MDLSIIIVSWQVKEQLRKNLQSLWQATGCRWRPEQPGLNCEVFVVDNNSSDGTVEMVRQEFPQVKVIANRHNFGFAGAVNQVMREASGRVVLLLNPDMVVPPQTLSQTVRWLQEHPEAGAMSCRLVDERGKIVKHVRRFPKWTDQLAIILKLPHFFPNILNHYLRSDFDYQTTAKVASVRGSFLAISRATIDKIGLLDERYFIWFEDVDYCRTMKKHKIALWYVGEIECQDYVGQSFKQVKTLTTQKYFRDSMLKYFAKWQPGWQTMILRLAWFLVWPVIWLVNYFGLKSKAKT